MCGGRLVVAQPCDGYRFSLDAVLLAWWTAFSPDDRILDAGAGVGVVALALAACRGARDVTALELQPELADFARENVSSQNLGGRVRVVAGDLRALPAEWRGRYDVVCANPPFREAGTGRLNAAPSRAAARHEISLTMAELARAASFAVKPGGRLFLVHQPRRLDDIFRELAAVGLNVEILRFVHPREGEAANLVLAAARAGGAGDVKVLPPLVIYGIGQEYGAEVAAIYAGDGRPLGGGR